VLLTLRKLLPAIIVNVVLVLFFIYSNFAIWGMVNGTSINYANGNYNYNLVTSHWSPFGVDARHFSYYNGSFGTVAGIFWSYNFPYWLFFVSTAINIYFIAKLAKNKT